MKKTQFSPSFVHLLLRRPSWPVSARFITHVRLENITPFSSTPRTQEGALVFPNHSVCPQHCSLLSDVCVGWRKPIFPFICAVPAPGDLFRLSNRMTRHDFIQVHWTGYWFTIKTTLVGNWSFTAIPSIPKCAKYWICCLVITYTSMLIISLNSYMECILPVKFK